MLKLSLCDYSDAYILLSGTVTVVGADDAAIAADGNNNHATIIQKISETNSSLYVKQCPTKNLISFVEESFASINKTFTLGGRLGTRISSYEVQALF